MMLGLVVTIALAGAPPAAVSPAENTYRQLELFARVLSYVQNNYVEAVSEEQLMRGAIRGMLETLDPHTQYMAPEVFREMKADTSGEFGGVGIELVKKDDDMVVVTPVEDTPAHRAGIRVGDHIVAIDEALTRGMDLGQAIARLRGPAGKKVVLTIMREGFSAPREFTVIRDHIRVASVEGALYGGIGHVRVKNFQERTDASLARELDRLRARNGGAQLKGLVLDLRNNPGGLLDQAVAVSDRFLPGGLPIVSTRGRGITQLTEERSRERDTEPAYPVVVLVNAGSASASEIVAGALQDHHRAVLLGTPTFGKGSVQTVIEMDDGSGLKLTIARYYTPSGRSIQERGIVPDYVVPDTEGGAVVRTDVVREKDLKRHFKAEGEAQDSALAVSLPPALEPVPEAATLADYQLRTALGYLNAQLAAPAKAQVRPAR